MPNVSREQTLENATSREHSWKAKGHRPVKAKGRGKAGLRRRRHVPVQLRMLLLREIFDQKLESKR